MSLEGNPYDGHTLGKQLSRVRSLLDEGKMREVFVDRGYRGHKHEGEERYPRRCGVLSNAERQSSRPSNI